jgi:hypothetical protein
MADNDEAGDCMVYNGIEFVEKVSNNKFCILEHWKCSVISLEVCGGCDGRNFLKIHPSSVASHPLATHAIINVQKRFRDAVKFPRQPLNSSSAIHIILCSPFSTQRSIGKQSIHVKASAIAWNQSKLAYHIKIASRSSNFHITINICNWIRGKTKRNAKTRESNIHSV